MLRVIIDRHFLEVEGPLHARRSQGGHHVNCPGLSELLSLDECVPLLLQPGVGTRSLVRKSLIGKVAFHADLTVVPGALVSDFAMVIGALHVEPLASPAVRPKCDSHRAACHRGLCPLR